MKKSSKVILGIVTLSPFLYVLIFIPTMFLLIFLNGGQDPDEMPLAMSIMFGIYFSMFPLMFALTIYYIVNVFRNELVTQETKALWAVVLFIGNMFAMPVYWYIYIWREPKGVSESIPPTAHIG